MAKAFDEEMKARISDLFETEHMTNGEIARALGISTRSVRRYRHYLNQDPSESMPVEKGMSTSQDPIPHTNQTIEEPELNYQDNQIQEDTTEDPEHVVTEDEKTIEQEEDSKKKSWKQEEVLECPECGNPKSKCLTIDQAIEQGYGVKEGYERFYDYACPNCRTLFPDYRYSIQGTCPGCSSTSRDWAPFEETFVSDEIKREYDFLCLNCGELIKISD